MKKNLIPIVFCLHLCFFHFNSFAQWAQKADVGSSTRSEAVGFSIGSKGYIGTGYNCSTFNYVKDFWEYDPSTNTWSQKADFGGTARAEAVGFGIGTKGYIGTGENGFGDYSDFWEYDPSGNSWTQKASFTAGTREGSVGFSIGSKGYVGVGSTFSGTSSLEFWEYNPSTDSWSRKADFPGATRVLAAGFSIGSKGYIGIGKNYGGSGSYDDFYQYDPVTDTWLQRATFPGGARSAGAGFGIDTKGYIGTGITNNGSTIFNDFWEYDQFLDTWTQKANFSGGVRLEDVGFSIGSKGYIGTGITSVTTVSCTKDFWEYSPPAVLTMGALSGTSFCQGASITIPYSSTATTFNSGNVFTVQLSNSSGSFASPTTLGTLTSTSPNGNISINAPSLEGYGYRIRVVSSNPSMVSNDNGVNLIFTQYYTTHFVGGWDYTVYTGSEQYLSTDWKFGYSFLWSVASAPGSYGSGWVFGPSGGPTETTSQVQFYPFEAGYYNVLLTVSGTCGTYYYYTSTDVHNPWDFRYIVSPNPASSVITIMQNPKSHKTGMQLNESIKKVSIFDNSGNLKKLKTYGPATKQAQLDVSDLKLGIYYVEISYGDSKERQKIIIRRD